MKKYIAEGFGTFVLALVVILSLTHFFSISTPVLAALTVALFVYAFAEISGGHINPAVTVGLWSIQKIEGREALKYILAQFIGGGLAYLAFSLVSDGRMIYDPVSANFLTIALAEFVGMFVYGFLIAAFVLGKVPQALFGVFIGGALLLGITVAILIGSEGFIHPAVALAASSLSWAYLLAPLAGSIAGMKLFKFLDN